MNSFNEKILNVVSNIASNGTTNINNPFKDKWVSILGDDVSTYEGYIPEGNETYYPNGDVDDVSKTWWHQLLTRLGAKLCVNDSWNGRYVCGEDAKDVKNACNKLHRVKGQTYTNLDGSTEEATEDIKPDIILIMLGRNDFNDNKTLGEYKVQNFYNYTSSFYNAYNYMLQNVCGVNYPYAQIYCLEMSYTDIHSFLGSNSNENTIYDFNEAIEKEAKMFCKDIIYISRAGITGMNTKKYLIDEYPNNTHPNAACMPLIANRCYNEMMANNCF